MRYTEYHAGVPVIKKQYWTEAAAKLAHFEDAVEMEDTDELVRELELGIKVETEAMEAEGLIKAQEKRERKRQKNARLSTTEK